MTQEIGEELIYKAFISYNHNPRDISLAKTLVDKIERYKAPKEIANNVTQVLKKVYRDKDEAPAGKTLDKEIRSALERSKKLVVICSPDAESSQWVNDEILHFQDLGRSDDIIPIYSTKEGLKSMPPALKRLGGDNLIAADFSNYDPTKPNKVDSVEFTRLVAGLFDVNFDDLSKREQVRARQRSFNIAIASSAIAIASIAIALIMYQLRNDAIRSETKAIENEQLAQQKQAEAESSQERALLAAEIANDQRKLADERLNQAKTQRIGYLNQIAQEGLLSGNDPNDIGIFLYEGLKLSDGVGLQPNIALINNSKLALDLDFPKIMFQKPDNFELDGIRLSKDESRIMIWGGLRSLAAVSSDNFEFLENDIGWMSMGWESLSDSVYSKNFGYISMGSDLYSLYGSPSSQNHNLNSWYENYENLIYLDDFLETCGESVFLSGLAELLRINPNNGEVIENLSHSKPVIASFCDQTGNSLVSIDVDGNVLEWKKTDGKFKKIGTSKIDINAWTIASFNHSSQNLYYLNDDSIYRKKLNDSENAIAVISLSGETLNAISSNSDSVAVATEGGQILIWSETGGQRRISSGQIPIIDIELKSNGEIITLSSDETLRLWPPIVNEEKQFQIIDKSIDSYGAFALSSNKKYLVVSNNVENWREARLIAIDLEESRIVWSAKFPGRTFGFGQLAISDDGRIALAASTCACESVVLVEATFDPRESTVSSTEFGVSEDRFYFTDISIDGKKVLYLGQNEILLYDLESKRFIELGDGDISVFPKILALSSYEKLFHPESMKMSIVVNDERWTIETIAPDGHNFDLSRKTETGLVFAKLNVGSNYVDPVLTIAESQLEQHNIDWVFRAVISDDLENVAIIDNDSIYLARKENEELETLQEMLGAPMDINFDKNGNILFSTSDGALVRWDWSQIKSIQSLADQLKSRISGCLSQDKLDSAYFSDLWPSSFSCE